MKIEEPTNSQLRNEIGAVVEVRFKTKEEFVEWRKNNEIQIKALMNYNKAELQAILAALKTPDPPELPEYKIEVISEMPVDPELGARDFVRESTGVTRVEAEGGGVMTQMRDQIKSGRVLQPVLTLEEAAQLGAKQWWPWRVRGQFTTIDANGRRYVIDERVAEGLKNRGGTDFVSKPRR
ncbi:MAG: hypothetical protein P1R58_10940 [bacterium]|nr:hypothetical protein [bacterium]